jgi:hypothetical protein
MMARIRTGFASIKAQRRTCARLLGPVVAAGLLWTTALLDARPASASSADVCAVVKCVLACNARTHLCARYPVGKVPRGYTIRSKAPPGYVRVRGFTECDRRICPDRTNAADCPLGNAVP